MGEKRLSEPAGLAQVLNLYQQIIFPHRHLFTCSRVDTLTRTELIKEAHVWTCPQAGPMASLQITRKQTRFCLCVNSVWAKDCACSAQRYESPLHSFSPCCIWFSSLHWAPSSPATTALALHNLSLRDSPNHKTSCLLSNVLPLCGKDGLKNWVELGALWPGPLLPLCRGGFKDKWLHVNQIWHAVQRQAPLVPGHSQTENTTSGPGKNVRHE